MDSLLLVPGTHQGWIIFATVMPQSCDLKSPWQYEGSIGTDRPGRGNREDVNGLFHKTPAELEQGLFVRKAVRRERECPTSPVLQGPQEREGEAEGDSLERHCSKIPHGWGKRQQWGWEGCLRSPLVYNQWQENPSRVTDGKISVLKDTETARKGQSY